MKSTAVDKGPGALDLIEEASHLLWTAPVRVWALYYMGAAPFVMALLYFLVVMRLDPPGDDRGDTLALGVALLYLWMRCWQALFCAALRARWQDEPLRLSGGALRRLIGRQCRWSPWSLLLTLIGGVAALPYVFAQAFHQNLAAMSDSDDDRSSGRRAGKLAALWPRQQIVAQMVLTLFSVLVALNIALLLRIAPQLLKSVLGVETPMSRHPLGIFQLSFVGIVLGMTYLCVDPLCKALYVCRCQAGESLRSGLDLRVRLRRLSALRLALFALLLPAPAALPARAAEAVPCQGLLSEAFATADAESLAAALRENGARPRYAWQAPAPAPAPAPEPGLFKRFTDAVRHFLQPLQKGWSRFMKWLFPPSDHNPFRRRSADPATTGLRTAARLLLILTALGAGLLLLRYWRRKSKPPAAETAVRALSATPDVRDESALASAHPEEEWLRLAKRLEETGDLRGALRALFLALLARLHARKLIKVLRWKSNRDYQRELQRRSRRQPALAPLFAEIVALYERGWYGRHPVCPATLQQAKERVCDLGGNHEPAF
jgi:hypothetical protein